MIVQGYTLPLVAVPGVKMPLYPHQAEIYTKWDQAETFLLITRTGSGKTAASVLPIVINKERAVLVYPTNELIRDQGRSIVKLLEAEGITYRVINPDNVGEKVGAEEIDLVRIDANLLESFRKKLGKRSKGDALKFLLHADRPKLILINPDILYLIYSLRYAGGAEAISALQAYKTVVFDEFHLYRGVELAHILFLIYLARQLHAFKKVVLLSATPHFEVMELLDTLFKPKVIDANIQVDFPLVMEEKQVCYPVQFEALPEVNGIVETVKNKLNEIEQEIRELRRQNNSLEYIPCVVILNSVIQAIQLEDLLVEKRFDRKEIEPIRGLSAKGKRDFAGKLLVIGTSAIEVGVDFHCDYLIFEAGDAASFLQRFGRVARHKPGKAFLVADYREQEIIKNLPGTIEREGFEKTVINTYTTANAFAWFVRTFSGLITVYAQLRHMRKLVNETARGNTDIVSEFDSWMTELMDGYANILGIGKSMKLVYNTYKKFHKGVPGCAWLEDYESNMSFRTSLPSVDIFDWSEKRRGRDPEYSVDMITLIKRANNSPKYNEKMGKIRIDGFGEYHAVWVNKGFLDEESHDISIMRTTSGISDLIVLQDGHKSSVCYLLTKPRAHIFVVVPKELRNRLDWQIPTFSCGKHGKYIMAIDGAALLVKEIYRRYQKELL